MYILAFTFETGVIVASGLGYNGKDEATGADRWDKIIGVYIWDVETATNVNSLLKAWNHRVHIWLKYYVSERLTGAGNRPSSFDYMATYMISAFWHGFYPMYYINFFLAALTTFVHKDVYNMGYFFRGLPQPVKTCACIFLT